MGMPRDDTVGERKSTRKNVACVAVVLILLLGARIAWKLHADYQLRQVLDQIAARGEPIHLAGFASKPIPDEENAAELYREAVRAMAPLRAYVDKRRVVGVGGGSSSFVTALAGHEGFRREKAGSVQKILTLARPALDLSRKAGSLSKVDWKFELDESCVSEDTISVRRGLEPLARVLRLAAIEAHDRGTDASALDHLFDMMAFAKSVDSMPTGGISHVFSTIVWRHTVMAIETIAPRLRVGTGERTATDEQLDRLIHEILNETVSAKAHVMTYVYYRCLEYDGIQRRQRGQRSLGDGGWIQDETFLPWVKRIFLGPMLTTERTELLRDRTAVVSAATRHRFPGAGVEVRYRDFFAFHFSSLAIRRMAAVAPAIRRYESDLKKRPEALTDLVPRYLPAVPEDPFDPDGAPIAYLPDSTPPVLYSVSEDGVDDLGAFRRVKSRELGRKWKIPDLVFFLNGNRPTPKPRMVTEKRDKRP